MKSRGRKRNTIIGAAAALVVIGGYLGAVELLDRAAVLNDEVVDPGRLIRSGQPRPGDLKKIKEKEGLGTIFCLKGHETEDVTRWAEDNGVKLVCMEMKADNPPTPAQAGLFFDIMAGHTVALDQYREVIVETLGVQGPAMRFPLPVLIHCDGGADRTGVMVALYRMAFQGWDLNRAKRDMIRHFHVPFQHPAQFRFLEERARDFISEYEKRSAARKGA
jgi:protein tyrosine/serine phosphatase